MSSVRPVTYVPGCYRGERTNRIAPWARNPPRTHGQVMGRRLNAELVADVDGLAVLRRAASVAGAVGAPEPHAGLEMGRSEEPSGAWPQDL